jgi:hypothetical protein
MNTPLGDLDFLASPRPADLERLDGEDWETFGLTLPVRADPNVQKGVELTDGR